MRGMLAYAITRLEHVKLGRTAGGSCALCRHVTGDPRPDHCHVRGERSGSIKKAALSMRCGLCGWLNIVLEPRGSLYHSIELVFGGLPLRVSSLAFRRSSRCTQITDPGFTVRTLPCEIHRYIVGFDLPLILTASSSCTQSSSAPNVFLPFGDE